MPRRPQYLLLATSLLAAGIANAATVNPDVLARAKRDGETETLLVLAAHRRGKHVAPFAGDDYLARRRAIVAGLREHADTTQAPLRRWLEARGIEYRSYWISNLVVASLTPADIDALAQRPDIEKIEPNRRFPRQQMPHRGFREPKTGDVDGIPWGIELIGAPAVWATGTTGRGVVVAGQDTGYHWTHPALQSSYRGWSAAGVDHDYAWHDAISDADRVPDGSVNPCPNDSLQPCDDQGHGTHTMGTIVGDDALGNRIGVAPDARWIGCRNMDQGVGTPARYIECMQWLLAPTDVQGENADPDLAPDVINNSWGCDASEGCLIGSELRSAVDTLVDAGIFFVVAAGNGGVGCSTIAAPPAIYDSSFVVGATYEGDWLTLFSSRGPVLGSTLNRPDIVAPGESVVSAVPPLQLEGDYSPKSGTSMAAPHVAGVAALMMSANPRLKGHPGELARILRESASRSNLRNSLPQQNCGNVASTVWPNPMLGSGRLDALAAVRLAVAQDLDATGAWYDPAQSGHGLIVESLGEDRFSAWWFTFDDAGRQLWFGGLGVRDGEKFVATVSRVEGAGARFLPHFDPARVASVPVGILEFTFDHCNRGHLNYEVDIGTQRRTGSMPLNRLSSPTGTACDATSGAILPVSHSTPAEPRVHENLTGSWYDPARSGQGVVLQSLGDDRLLAWWFTFSPEGEPAWFGGIGKFVDGVAQIQAVRTAGGKFPPAFDASAVTNPMLGTLRLSFSDCSRGQLEFDLAAGFGKGTLPLQRLTLPANVSCAAASSTARH